MGRKGAAAYTARIVLRGELKGGGGDFQLLDECVWFLSVNVRDASV